MMFEKLKKWWGSTTPRDAELLFGTRETVDRASLVREEGKRK